MGMLDGLRAGFGWLSSRETVHERDEPVEEDSIADLLARRRMSRSVAWRSASNREALGVPAVFKAISLISNTIGTLSMEGYRNGAKMAAEDTPRVLIRPDPFTPPFDFWRDSSFHKARRGETWWWVAKRDGDGQALTILTIDPREITVERNPRSRLRPIIKWLGEEMPNDDMKLMKYLPDPENSLRGWGPLQACGAAVSVAVEAQEWAANWFGGNPANTWIKSALDLDKDEAQVLKEDWMRDTGNLPKVTGPSVEDVKDIGVEPERAQLADVRNFQNGEVALMFSMPASVLNYAIQGSNIVYQNVGQVWDDLIRECLLPHYLEPYEQTMSDLLSRSTIGRFNVEGLRRADIKTRFEVHGIAIDKGIYDAEEAARQEGLAPGDVENRPVPFAPPAAIVTLPVQERALRDVRCPGCNRLHTRSDGRVSGKCHRCGMEFVAA